MSNIRTLVLMTYTKPISYSGMKLWQACPSLWYDQYILGIRQPSGKAAMRGTQLHDKLERYFKREAPYPSGDRTLARWQPFMVALQATDPVAEGEVAVDANWRPVDYKSKEAYFRGKKDLDYTHDGVCHLFDWKSGKIYDDHYKQGEAYAALTPGYERYIVNFVYLDHPHVVHRWELDAPKVEAVKAELIDTIEIIRNATEFPATPGDKCTWCHKSWRNGGECKRAR